MLFRSSQLLTAFVGLNDTTWYALFDAAMTDAEQLAAARLLMEGGMPPSAAARQAAAGTPYRKGEIYRALLRQQDPPAE